MCHGIALSLADVLAILTQFLRPQSTEYGSSPRNGLSSLPDFHHLTSENTSSKTTPYLLRTTLEVIGLAVQGRLQPLCHTVLADAVNDDVG